MMDISNPHYCPDLLHELLFWWRLFNLRIRGVLKNKSMIMIKIVMVMISSIIIMTIKKFGIMDLKEEIISWTTFEFRF